MNTPNNAAALERLDMVIGSLRNFADVADRCVITEVVNSIPAMRVWAEELSEIRATLAQPDASWEPSSNDDYDRSIHSNPDASAWADFFVQTFPGQAAHRDLMLGWFANAMMAMHDHLKTKPDALTSQPSGEDYVDPDDVFLSQGVDDVPCLQVPGRVLARFIPGSWDRAYELFSGGTPSHPSADAPGVAVDEWRPIESAPKEAPYWVVWSAYYQRPVVVTNRSNDNTYWEGDWDFDVQATHWTVVLAPKPEGEL